MGASREKRKVAAQAARAALLKELCSFGNSLGDVSVKKSKVRARFIRQSHQLDFNPEGEEDLIQVSSKEGNLGSIARDVAGDWLLSLTKGGATEHFQLITAGLEELLVVALDFPRPQAPEPKLPEAPIRVSAVPTKAKEPRPDPTARATVDPSKPTPGSTVKDLHDPFA